MGSMDFGKAEALAAEIVAGARPPLRELYLTVASANHPDSQKARAVLNMLDELSVLPWLAAAQMRDGADKTKALMEAYRGSARFEQRLLEKLRPMLDRKSALPPPANCGVLEVTPPVTRECDEGYLLLRRLRNPDEQSAERHESESAFRQSPVHRRDEIIQRFSETGDFG